jgi:hypothetical protein
MLNSKFQTNLKSVTKRDTVYRCIYIYDLLNM